MVNKLILYFSEKYLLDKNRVKTLLSEYEGIQRRDGHILNEKEKIMIPILKRNERLRKFGHDDKTMVMGLVIPFIGDDMTCTNILLIWRQFNEVFKDLVYNQWLIWTDKGPLLKRKRLAIWSYFLNINNKTEEYESLRDKVNQNTEMIQSVEEVISMDVSRSFTNVKTLNQSTLKNILRTYAVYNAEIKYWQGMNFLAGFLLIYFNDEKTAFKALCGLIEKFQMTELFIDDLPLLKLFFYKLDRLVSMYLPDLYSHFKDECVNSSLYSASWFITLFSNTIQFQKSTTINEPLLKLWDFFLVHGFKGVFRAAIFLLKTFESCLYQLSFEQVWAFIPQMPRFLFVPDGEEGETTEMISNLVIQSTQSKDGKINEIISKIRSELDLNNNLFQYLYRINISTFILEKLDGEYLNIHRNSENAVGNDEEA